MILTMATLAFIGQNSILRARIEEVARGIGLATVAFPSIEAFTVIDAPVLIILELEQKGAIEAITTWKNRWPECMIAGAIRMPIQELWHAAVAAGADFVSNWGALPNQLRRKLETWRAGETLVKKAARLKLMLNEREGDGLVGRLPDAPDGPIVVFRLSEKLCAFRDVCPHAGASLADGELDGKIVTCPRHGSQFNVCSGSRLRGPADYPIRIYRVVSEESEVFVEI